MISRQGTSRPTGASSKADPGLSEIQAFFDRLAEAITSRDGNGAASLWAVPALVLGDGEARAIGSLTKVAAFFGGAKEQYNAKGITDTRAEIVELKWLTGRIVRVEVRWPYLDDTGAEKGEEVSTYLLLRDESARSSSRSPLPTAPQAKERRSGRRYRALASVDHPSS